MIIINTIYYNIISLGVLCIIPLALNAQTISDSKKETIYKLYQEKAKEHMLSPLEHDDYIEFMLNMGMYSAARQYVKKCINSNAMKTSYQLDLARVLMREGKKKQSDKMFNNVIMRNIDTDHQVRNMLNYFIVNHLFEKARYTIDIARKRKANNHLYAFEMGNLYYKMGNKEAMIREYINYFSKLGKQSKNYMQHTFQRILVDEGDMDILEGILYEYVQQQPDADMYADMLIWVGLQQRNFYNAYIRSKAYDKRFTKNGLKVLSVGRIALSNSDVDNASKAFSYVVEQYPGTENAMKAQLGIIHIEENKLKHGRWANKDSVRNLIRLYQYLIEKFPHEPTIYKTVIDQAHLYAYRLGEREEAIKKLNALVNKRLVPPLTRAHAKLELANIYVLVKEPWEATLLYAQVAHEQGDSPIGYLAKLSNAKLHYYEGNFDLAQSQLAILKEATTREIANDAMELSLRIKENTIEDTTGTILRVYAGIELLLEENQEDKALEAIEQLKKECEHTKNKGYKQNPILDDVYWLESKIRLKRNEWKKAYTLLQQIVTFFGQDVLADDALFYQAKILDEYQEDKSKAMDAYLDFIDRFPGSTYVDEARKRYRKLDSEKRLGQPQ